MTIRDLYVNTIRCQQLGQKLAALCESDLEDDDDILTAIGDANELIEQATAVRDYLVAELDAES